MTGRVHRPPPLQDARAFCGEFFHTYNHHHRHAGLGLLTPQVVQAGLAQVVRAARALVLDDAHTRYSNRVRRSPHPTALPGSSWINKPEEQPHADIHS